MDTVGLVSIVILLKEVDFLRTDGGWVGASVEESLEVRGGVHETVGANERAGCFWTKLYMVILSLSEKSPGKVLCSKEQDGLVQADWSCAHLLQMVLHCKVLGHWYLPVDTSQPLRLRRARNAERSEADDREDDVSWFA